MPTIDTMNPETYAQTGTNLGMNAAQQMAHQQGMDRASVELQKQQLRMAQARAQLQASQAAHRDMQQRRADRQGREPGWSTPTQHPRNAPNYSIPGSPPTMQGGRLVPAQYPTARGSAGPVESSRMAAIAPPSPAKYMSSPSDSSGYSPPSPPPRSGSLGSTGVYPGMVGGAGHNTRLSLDLPPDAPTIDMSRVPDDITVGTTRFFRTEDGGIRGVGGAGPVGSWMGAPQSSQQIAQSGDTQSPTYRAALAKEMIEASSGKINEIGRLTEMTEAGLQRRNDIIQNLNRELQSLGLPEELSQDLVRSFLLERRGFLFGRGVNERMPEWHNLVEVFANAMGGRAKPAWQTPLRKAMRENRIWPYAEEPDPNENFQPIAFNR